jgi:DNA-binding response OmpR family regulator
MLPGRDGFSVLRAIREDRLQSAVLILSARGEEWDRIQGFEYGADDYVVKPFSAPEVVARVRAQLRRAQGFESASPAPLRVGSLEVDPASRLVSVDGRDVSLTRREFDLLVALMSSPNRVYRREELLELVWGSEFLSAKTVDVHVAGLRRKLGSSVKITALRGVGYRFEA